MAYHYQNTEQNLATKIANPVKCVKLKKSGNDTNKLKPKSLKNYRQVQRKECLLPYISDFSSTHRLFRNKY